MRFKEPKDTDQFSWTKHIKEKMKFYGLSERRLKRVLKNPTRQEKGIAPGTIAIMQRAGTKKHPTEIWLMYQIVKIKKREKIRMISSWRYPGQSPVGEKIPIPDDILEELNDLIKKK